jgi:hypothetical protein
MNKKSVEDFIIKCLKPEKEISNTEFEVSYTFKNKNPNIDAEIKILNNSFIFYVKKSFAYDKNINYCKTIILHELGHYVTSVGKCSGINEYNAHLWAVKKAINLKLYNVFNNLMDCLDSWKSVDWTNGRIYRIAYKIALQKNNLLYVYKNNA